MVIQEAVYNSSVVITLAGLFLLSLFDLLELICFCSKNKYNSAVASYSSATIFIRTYSSPNIFRCHIDKEMLLSWWWGKKELPVDNNQYMTLPPPLSSSLSL